jgi:hypothetical protein
MTDQSEPSPEALEFTRQWVCDGSIEEMIEPALALDAFAVRAVEKAEGEYHEARTLIKRAAALLPGPDERKLIAERARPPEHPTEAMIERGVAMHRTLRSGLDETLVHDIWQAMMDEWLADKLTERG